MPNQLQKIHDEQYVAKSSQGVAVIDFRSDWCPPCRTMDTVLSKVATTHSEVTFLSLTVNQEPLIAKAVGVMSTPTILIKKDGRIVDALIGTCTVGEFDDRLARVLQ